MYNIVCTYILFCTTLISVIFFTSVFKKSQNTPALCIIVIPSFENVFLNNFIAYISIHPLSIPAYPFRVRWGRGKIHRMLYN